MKRKDRTILMLAILLGLLASMVHAGTPFTPVAGVNILPAGEFDLKLPASNLLPVPCEIRGVRDKTILNGFAAYKGDNLTIRDLIRRGGLFLDKPGGRNRNIIIDNVIFEGPIGDAIKFTSGLSNSRITNCVFRHQGWAIYGYNGDNLTIANNEFYGVGTHIAFFGTASQNANITVEQNYGTGISGAFFELQGAVQNAIVQDNDADKFLTTDNDSKYFLSIPWQDGNGVIVRRNRCILPLKSATPARWYVRITFELGGKNLDAYDNYSVGGNDVCAINGAGATGRVHDNRFLNFDHATYNNNGSTCALANNGANVQLTWDINRPRPARNVRYGTPIPAPAPTPEPVPPAPPPATYPTTQWVNDPVIEVQIRQQSGKVTVTKP